VKILFELGFAVNSSLLFWILDKKKKRGNSRDWESPRFDSVYYSDVIID